MSAAKPPVLQVELTAAQLDELVTRIVARLQAPVAETYDQHHLPRGLSRRVYLEAARAGSFPVTRVGRTVFCARKDLDAWLAARAAKAAARAASKPATREAQVLADIATRNGAKVH